MTAEFLIGLARTLREVVRPLEEALESPEAFGVLLLEHGWHGGADAELVQAFAERLRFDDLVAVLVDALDEVLGVNGVEVEEAAEVLDAAVELLRALHELTLAAPIAAGPAPLDRPEFWRSFPSDLGQSLLATYLELRRPTLFAAATCAQSCSGIGCGRRSRIRQRSRATCMAGARGFGTTC